MTAGHKISSENLTALEAVTLESREDSYLPHLERDLRLIRRYTFIHSDTPLPSNVPLVGPLIGAVKRAARGMLRRAVAPAMGTQAEFNAAVAEVLFEFTRRAATSSPLALNDSALDEALRLLSNTVNGHEQAQALALLAREIGLLREQVRAAQLSASESERAASELLRRVAALEARAGNK